MKAVVGVFALLLTNVEFSYGANILFFYGVAARSHRTCVEPLAHKLVERGHNVTFLTPIKPEKPNPKFHEFCPSLAEEQYKKLQTGIGDTGFLDRSRDKHANFMTEVRSLVEFQTYACEAVFKSPDFKPWMERSHFDIIFLSHAANKCGYALAYKYNAPVIVQSASTFFVSEEDTFGFPVETSWLRKFHISNIFTEMSFYDRVYSFLTPLIIHLYSKWLIYPKMDQTIQDCFQGENIPPLEELERNLTALFFINQHFSEDFARSLPPMVVPVGGMHCTDEHKTLPREIEEFIEGAGDAGFVLISFGSMIKMSKVPEHIMELFFSAIKNLKTRFIWRWDSEPPANLPKNVYTEKWLPQQDLLAHPRIKGFISHGGIMSLQQAIFNAVPLIVLPVVYDQPFNAFRAKHHGIAIHLELSELTEKTFHDAVVKLVEDKSLHERVKVVSQRFRDRPISAVDTAVYWTEYAVRHKDLSHLKPLGIHQSWWERRHLDVWTSVMATTLAFILVLAKFLQLMTCIICNVVAGSPKKLKVN